jgi:hypothetical protein
MEWAVFEWQSNELGVILSYLLLGGVVWEFRRYQR